MSFPGDCCGQRQPPTRPALAPGRFARGRRDAPAGLTFLIRAGTQRRSASPQIPMGPKNPPCPRTSVISDPAGQLVATEVCSGSDWL